MSSIKGTNVVAPVVPFDTADVYATHQAKYGRGGYRSVADATERDAITAERREAGMLVFTISDGKLWKLSADLSSWSEFVTGSASVAWSAITDKPLTFAPAQHTHSVADVSGLQAQLDGKQTAGNYAAASHTHTSSQVSDFAAAVVAAAPPTTNASLLTSGTVDAARLPASVVLTTDSRLSDARNPLSHVHSVSDVTGLQTALDSKQAAGSYAAASHTHTASQVSGLASVATSGSYLDLLNTPTIPAATTDASLLNSGTLPDARLSSNVATNDVIAKVDNQPPSGIDIYLRGDCANLLNAPPSGAVWITFFTPATTVTVSSITMATGNTTAASGLTLARMGLYTFDETTATLVARCASDTSLFAAVATSYQRSFSTAGSFPSSYQLVAGTRYGVAVLCTGTTMPNLAARAVGVGASALSPRMSAVISGQTDLPASATITASQQTQPYARLS